MDLILAAESDHTPPTQAAPARSGCLSDCLFVCLMWCMFSCINVLFCPGGWCCAVFRDFGRRSNEERGKHNIYIYIYNRYTYIGRRLLCKSALHSGLRSGQHIGLKRSTAAFLLKLNIPEIPIEVLDKFQISRPP